MKIVLFGYTNWAVEELKALKEKDHQILQVPIGEQVKQSLQL